MNSLRLSFWESGHEGVVTGLEKTPFTDRLRELGVVPGSWIKVIQSGSPMLIQAGESRICLRRSDAQMIEVENALNAKPAAIKGRALPVRPLSSSA